MSNIFSSSKHIIGFTAMATILVMAGLLMAFILDIIDKDSFSETSVKAIGIILVSGLAGFALTAIGHLLSGNSKK